MKTSIKYMMYALVAMFAFVACECNEPEYQVYWGNTHAHCNYSGDILRKHARMGTEIDPQNTLENIFRLAKENAYDFYFVTDHSQYECYTPEAWVEVKAVGEKFTDETFVGLRGYEHSENDGPDGTGHMNVYNSDTFLSALAEGVSLEYFHNWLALPENKDVIACFNHPQKNAYNDFHCYNEAAKSHLTTMELINGNKPKFLPTFIHALDKGWKVSPVAGCDNHKWQNIALWKARTGLWCTELTSEGIYDAMASRRTFATMDKNMSLKYSVNGKFMGSDIKKANKYKFKIEINDPDVDNENSVITKIDIYGENGQVLESKDFAAHEICWEPVLASDSKYFFVVVYSNAVEDLPTAFAAPVWII